MLQQSRTFSTLLLLLFTLTLSACSAVAGPPPSMDSMSTTEKILYVGPERVDCVGVAPQQCYLVKENLADEWSYLYDEIDGFDYEPGYLYEIRLLEEPVENPPADASSIRRSLLEIVSREMVESPEATIPGRYMAELPAASSPGRLIALNLDQDGSATLSTNYLNSEAPIVEIGAWQRNDAGTVAVTLTGRSDRTYDEPVSILFELRGENLNAVEYDQSRYGSEGLPLTRSEEPLAGTAWELVEILMMDDSIFTPENPSDYTLAFSNDGMVSGRIDCNQMSGSYMVDGSQLSFGPLATTRAMCPPDSLFDLVVQGLDSANSFVMDSEGHLHIAFGPDAGILVYRPAGE